MGTAHKSYLLKTKENEVRSIGRELTIPPICTIVPAASMVWWDFTQLIKNFNPL